MIVKHTGSERQVNVDLFNRLTERQRQVAKMMAVGLPNRAIVKKLGISQKTLDIHRARIRRKLGCEREEIPKVVFSALGVLSSFKLEA